MESSSNVTVEATVVRAAIPVVPTLHPDDVGGTVIVHNHITINFNSAAGEQFLAKMDELLDHLRQSNEHSPDVKDQLIAEMKAAVEIAKAPKISREQIEMLLTRPPKSIAKTSAGAMIGKLAAQPLEWLEHLINGFMQ
jgi:hypothetical protein